jgi:hypothetical protein
MPTTLDQTRLLVESYAAQQARLTAALLRILLLLWGRIPSWNDPDMLDAWAARSAVEVDVALAQARRLTRAFTLTHMRLNDAAPDLLPDPIDSYERGGAAIVEVYKRPWRERAYVERTTREEGGTPQAVSEKGKKAFEERLATIVRDDVMLTARDEAQKVYEASPKVIGYRRVIHPELSESGTCGLCVVASTRLYSTSELMEIHDNCKCTVAEVTSVFDPGLTLNREDLDAIYNAAGSNYAEQLKQLRVRTVEHGELGPMLLRSGSKWVDPATVNRRAKREAARATPYQRQTPQSTQTNWRAMKATSQKAIRYLENARSRGTNVVDMGYGPREIRDLEVAIQYHRDLIARAERHAA